MKYKKIPNDLSVYIRYLHQDKHIKISEIVKRYPEYAKSTIYELAKKKITGKVETDKRHQNKGRPPKLTLRDKRAIVNAVPKL